MLDFKGMDREQIEKRIEKAFSGLNYPGNQDLTVHPLGLDECFYESLINKNWKQLDSEFLNYHHDCIGVLTAKGFQYYIAAFLLEDIKSETAISDQMLWDFSQAILEDSSPIKEISGEIWFNERIEILSKAQRSCLVSYFQYMKASEDEEGKALIDIVIEAINEI
jgi:hypothetical protein